MGSMDSGADRRGVVSLPGASYAEEKPSPVLSALSATTLSGFVDTSAHWNLGTGNANLPFYTPNGQPGGTKADGVGPMMP